MNYTVNYSNPLSLIGLDVQTLQTATKSIDMAAYALAAPEIVAALVEAAGRGVMVRIYLDRTELEAAARGDMTMASSPMHQLLNLPNVSLLVKQSSILMHLKSYCVDGITLRDGSANYSDPGEESQDNSLFLTNDPTLIAGFQAKFNAMWGRPTNMSVASVIASKPQTHLKPLHMR